MGDVLKFSWRIHIYHPWEGLLLEQPSSRLYVVKHEVQMEQQSKEVIIPANSLKNSGAETRAQLERGKISYLLVCTPSRLESFLDKTINPIDRIIVSFNNVANIFDKDKQKETARHYYNHNDISYPVISPADIPDDITFDGGAPIDGTLYVRHPLKTKHFLFPATANRKLEDEKLSAVRQLASLLGSANTEISLIREQKVKSSFFGGLRLFGNEQDSNGVSAGHHQGASHSNISRSSFSNNADSEIDITAVLDNKKYPPELKAWIHSDPDIQSIVTQRIAGKADKINVKIQTKSEVTVDSSLSINVDQYGIQVGGKIEAFYSKTWDVEISFHS